MSEGVYRGRVAGPRRIDVIRDCYEAVGVDDLERITDTELRVFRQVDGEQYGSILLTVNPTFLRGREVPTGGYVRVGILINVGCDLYSNILFDFQKDSYINFQDLPNVDNL